MASFRNRAITIWHRKTNWLDITTDIVHENVISAIGSLAQWVTMDIEILAVGDRIAYETGWAEYGFGRVVSYDRAADVLVVEDEDDGSKWIGPSDRAEKA